MTLQPGVTRIAVSIPVAFENNKIKSIIPVDNEIPIVIIFE